MTVLGIAAVTGVSFCLLVSLLFQIRPFSRRLTLLDRFGLLPRWLFFAHGRGRHDCHIVVRDRLTNGTLSPWEPLDPVGRPVWTTLWNPSKHVSAILWNAAETLNNRRRAGKERGVDTSLCYLLVLRHCMYKHPHSKQARARQFALVETKGRTHRDLWVGFTSDFHPF